MHERGRVAPASAHGLLDRTRGVFGGGMKIRSRLLIAAASLVLAASLITAQSPGPSTISEGQRTFRFDTFGDEQLWTDTLQLHTRVGTITPATALDVGLKVDVEALPAAVVELLKANPEDVLNDPAVTLQLLQINAVVGVKGTVSGGTL